MPARLLARILAAAALLPLLSACGIYQIVSINAPIAGITEAGGIFRFEAPNLPPEQIVIFRGFELYYKFYAAGQPIADGDDSLFSLQELQLHGFRRISSGISTDGYTGDRIGSIRLPLIPVPPADRGLSFEVTVDFSQQPPRATAPATTVPTVNLLRGIADNRTGVPLDTFKPFTAFGFPVPGTNKYDGDIDDMIWNLGGGNSGTLTVQVLLYVLSYGKDDQFNDVYSIPEFLLSSQVVFTNQP